jgi:hypothetical protein
LCQAYIGGGGVIAPLVVEVTPEQVTFGAGVIRFVLPGWARYAAGSRPTACRSCNAKVLFVNARKSGRRAPINPDGSSHFATCPDAAAWRASERGTGPQAVTTGEADASAPRAPSHLPGGS